MRHHMQTWLDVLEKAGDTPENRESALNACLYESEDVPRSADHLLNEDSLPFLAYIRDADPRLWLSHVAPLLQFWSKEDRSRFDKLLDEYKRDTPEGECKKMVLVEILNPELGPETVADLLKQEDPAGHEWVADEVADRLIMFADPGMGQYRAVVNDFFHRARYSPETRQQIKSIVARKSLGKNGNIASRVKIARSYANEPPPPQVYQHPQIMALSGVTVLAGRPKMGKSYLALNLALAITKGGMFLSHFPMQYEGDVLYLALEDNESRMYGRICALLGEDEEPPPNLWLDYYAPTLDEGVLTQEIEEWIQLPEVKQPRLIVIDIFRMVQSSRGRKDDIYELEYSDMTQLTKLARTYNVHILIVTHLNKSYSAVEDMADAVMSSTAITGGASGIWVLSGRGEERCDAELHISGKDIPRWSCGLQQIRLDGHMDWKALGDINSVLQGDVKIEILTTLFKWDGRAPTQTELRDALSSRIDRGNFARLLKKMRADALIKVERNRYHLTQAGAGSAEIFDNLDNDDNNYNKYNKYNETELADNNQLDKGVPWEDYQDDSF